MPKTYEIELTRRELFWLQQFLIASRNQYCALGVYNGAGDSVIDKINALFEVPESVQDNVFPFSPLCRVTRIDERISPDEDDPA